jgi:hypothetical protein
VKHVAIDDRQGIWLTPDENVYCRWKWEPAERILSVDLGEHSSTWTVPELDNHGASGIQLDLPETAKDFAAMLQRQVGPAQSR